MHGGTDTRRRWRVLLPLLLLAWMPSACGGGASEPDPDAGPSESVPPTQSAETFDVATWNLEWFGSVGNGPADEALQLANVRAVIAGADVDLWSVQEVVDERHFAELLDGLPGYAGLLADETTVTLGPAFYRDYGDLEQKVGIVYRPDVVELLGAEVILGDEDFAFAGRPPVAIRVRLRPNGTLRNAVVVLLHAKAGDSEEDWARRHDAALALKSYLDGRWPDEPVWVLGDFNDDVDRSITGGITSPYAAFLEDTAAWSFPTAAISAGGISSTVYWPEVIDHHLVSNEAGAFYVDGSAEVLRPDTLVAGYGATTSDHRPVVSRYRISEPGGAP